VLPPVNLRPPFNISRSSHLRLNVADLAESRNFYTNILGLVVTEEDDATCYVRGLQEACHHSLVLEKSRDGEPGDVVLTGTPAGVGLSTGGWTKVGDRLDGKITGLGALHVEIVEEGIR